MNLDTIVCSDALEFMRTLPDASCDMILCDLPYGTTGLAWDSVIPLTPLWEQFKRVNKPCSAIVLTASQPFTTKLIASNLDMFRYSWVWIKSISGGIFDAKNKPLKRHEDVLIFSSGTTANGSKNQMNYYPQGLHEIRGGRINRNTATKRAFFSPRPSHGETYVQQFEGYPHSVLDFSNDRGLHPTQKPVALFEYLIRTYTQAGDVVLDCCIGSGTTAVAARNLGRHFIGCDNGTDEKTGKLWATIANERLAEPYTLPMLEG